MNEKVAIITGAARGIGAATAREFAQRGYRLALVDIQLSDLSAINQELSQIGAEVIELSGDLADLKFVESIARTAADRWGRIDVVVNNAAWREIKSMREIALDSWEKTLRICLTAPAFLSRWAAQYMERQSQGVIVNVSSIQSYQVAGISPAYVACKGAIESLTYELASLYGPSGIRVVAVSPGAIDTDMSRELTSPKQEEKDAVRNFSEEMIMLGRWGRPAEIAQAIAWLASDDASYITATTLVIDGGWLHQHFPRPIQEQQFRK